jgi:hypothetical protein
LISTHFYKSHSKRDELKIIMVLIINIEKIEGERVVCHHLLEKQLAMLSYSIALAATIIHFLTTLRSGVILALRLKPTRNGALLVFEIGLCLFGPFVGPTVASRLGE